MKSILKTFNKAVKSFSTTTHDTRCAIFHNHDKVHAFQNIYVESYPRLSYNLFKVYIYSYHIYKALI